MGFHNLFNGRFNESDVKKYKKYAMTPIKMQKHPVISTKTAPHFFWGNHCEGWWLKKNGHFTVICEIMPKGSSEKRHFHRETEQFFYILEGTLSIELDDVVHHLQQNESIAVMSRIKHKVFNQSDQHVKFLVISSPDSHEDRVNVGE